MPYYDDIVGDTLKLVEAFQKKYPGKRMDITGKLVDATNEEEDEYKRAINETYGDNKFKGLSG